jgi:undecaprenyl diphosphate synthase
MTEANIPKHVAIIMDGNGRWAERRGLPRTEGHRAGVERVEEITRAAWKLGIRYLTLYAFSKENWRRPRVEVSFLMDLLSDYLNRAYREIEREDGEVEKSVFNVIGRLDDLPLPIRRKIQYVMEKTKNNPGIVTTLALSYSGRGEIVEACQRIARKVLTGEIEPKQVTEETVAQHLYTVGLPDPELLIRTSGEVRLSNFLLWQISYSEIYITEKCWPEFMKEDLARAVRAYQKRERRFGRVAV